MNFQLMARLTSTRKETTLAYAPVLLEGYFGNVAPVAAEAQTPAPTRTGAATPLRAALRRFTSR